MAQRISLLVVLDGDASALAHTLGAFAPAAIDGLIADACVLGPAGDLERDVAEEAGAALVAAPPLDALLDGLRGDWVLAVEAGWSPPDGWEAAAAARMLAAPRRSIGLAQAGPGWRAIWPFSRLVGPRLAVLWPGSAARARLTGLADVGAVRGCLRSAARGAARLRPLRVRR